MTFPEEDNAATAAAQSGTGVPPVLPATNEESAENESPASSQIVSPTSAAALATPAAREDGLLPPSEHPIRLASFEGPLDLLLYLIRKNEIDIYDIPIETVTRQYLEILRTTERGNLEVAGEFFVMAATLMYIKSRMLLPPDKLPETDPAADAETQAEHELDPRWELVSQLIQYKKIKECAAHLDALIAERQNHLPRHVGAPVDEPAPERPLTPADRIDLWNTFNRILERLADRLTPGEIRNETTTISSRMEDILARLKHERRFTLTSLLPANPTIALLVSTFLACLELARLGQLYLAQGELFDEIYCDTDPPPIPPAAAIPATLLPGRKRYLAARLRAQAAEDAEDAEAAEEGDADKDAAGDDEGDADDAEGTEVAEDAAGGDDDDGDGDAEEDAEDAGDSVEDIDDAEDVEDTEDVADAEDVADLDEDATDADDADDADEEAAATADDSGAR